MIARCKSLSSSLIASDAGQDICKNIVHVHIKLRSIIPGACLHPSHLDGGRASMTVVDGAVVDGLFLILVSTAPARDTGHTDHSPLVMQVPAHRVQQHSWHKPDMPKCKAHTTQLKYTFDEAQTGVGTLTGGNTADVHTSQRT